MYYLRYLLLLLVVSTISGCGLLYLTAPNIEHSDVEINPKMSLIVGSVTQSSDGVPASFDERVYFYFRQKDGQHRFRLESAEIMRPIWGPPNKALADPGLEEFHGKLFAVQIQPGNYQIVRFAIEGVDKLHINFADPLEFELVAGEVVYLGNLDARFCVRHAYANQWGVSGVIISVNDKLPRDDPLLRDKFIVLQHVKIVEKIIDNDALQKQATRLRKGCE